MADTQFITGDVFLFEHDDSCISRLICRLSGSPISHAAMYFENEMIIEEGLPHIGTRPVTKLGDRVVHVRRYRRSEASCKPLLAAAQKRLDAEEPYSMGNLVTVGILLVFNAWKPDARWAVKQALSALCILLAKAIDYKKTGGKHGATCSQLVFEMYEEAGFPLTIDRKCAADANSEDRSLVSLAMSYDGPGPALDAVAGCPENASRDTSSFDFEKMCCVLLSVLGEQDTTITAANTSDALDPELYGELVRFADLLRRADCPDEAGPAANNVTDWAKRALAHLLENYSGFVTPGQLYSDCPDLDNEIAAIGS